MCGSSILEHILIKVKQIRRKEKNAYSNNFYTAEPIELDPSNFNSSDYMHNELLARKIKKRMGSRWISIHHNFGSARSDSRRIFPNIFVTDDSSAVALVLSLLSM